MCDEECSSSDAEMNDNKRLRHNEEFYREMNEIEICCPEDTEGTEENFRREVSKWYSWHDLKDDEPKIRNMKIRASCEAYLKKAPDRKMREWAKCPHPTESFCCAWCQCERDLMHAENWLLLDSVFSGDPGECADTSSTFDWDSFMLYHGAEYSMGQEFWEAVASCDARAAIGRRIFLRKACEAVPMRPLEAYGFKSCPDKGHEKRWASPLARGDRCTQACGTNKLN